MKQNHWAVAGIGLFAASILLGRSKAKSMRPSRAVRAGQDILLASLLPPFRPKISMLIAMMADDGFEAIIANSARSEKKAAQYAAEGKGIEDSMHTLDAAVDIASRTKGWNDPLFFKALGRNAKRLRLTWGGDWAEPKTDPAHIQALPVADQKKFRAMTVAQRIAYLERLYQW